MDLLNVLSWCVVSRSEELTHWGQDKMAATLAEIIFKYFSLDENFWILDKISL